MSKKHNDRRGFIIATLLIALLLAAMIVSTSCEQEHIHAYSSWTVTKEPTCTEEGENYRTCPCGEVQTCPVEALGHTEVILEAVPATCTSEGFTEGKECSTCGLVLITQETTAITQHSYSKGKCSGCQKKLTPSKNLSYTLREDGKSYNVSGMGGCMDEEVYIPSTHNGLPVTGIDCLDDYFEPDQSKIIIPANITWINTDRNLIQGFTSVIVENDNSVYHSEGNCIIETATQTLIMACTTSVIPTNGSVRIIGDCALYCNVNSIITIPDGVVSIGEFAFYNSDNITSITLPDSVTSIGRDAFYSCDNLTKINIPNGVTVISDYMFQQCKSLTSIVIPDSVTSIETAAFSDCTSLTSVTIGNGVTSIGDAAFAFCTSLTSITIPKGVTTLNPSVFFDCESLTSITIPDSVTSIGWSAFKNCTSLKDVYFTGTEAQWNAITIDSQNDYLKNATIHYNSKN